MKRLYFIFFLLICSNTIFAQTFRKTYPLPNSYGFGISALQMEDKGFVFSGLRSREPRIIRTNDKGAIIWTKILDFDSCGNMIKTKDGGFALAGGIRKFLIKTDLEGREIWHKSFWFDNYTRANYLQQTHDEGYIISANERSNGVLIIRTDSKGDTLWTKKLDDGNNSEFNGHQIRQTKDYGFITIIDYHNFFFPYVSYSTKLVKLNTSGKIEWSKNLLSNYGKAIIETNDNGFAIAGLFEGAIGLIKTNNIGDTLWISKTNWGAFNHMPMDLIQTSDKGFILIANSGKYLGNKHVMIFKFDANGKVVWEKQISDPNNDIECSSIQPIEAGGFIIGGTKSSFEESEMLLIKTDSLGNTNYNIIGGRAYIDSNENCLFDIGEEPVSNAIIKALPGPLYGKTDSEGRYQIIVDTGSYIINFSPPKKIISQTCPANLSNHSIKLTSYENNPKTFDFGAKTISCQSLNVNIRTIRRRCFRNNTIISYENNGTMLALDAKVYIKFPKYVIPISADRPWTFNKIDSVYSINVGDVAAGQLGRINIIDSVICGDESIRSLTQCTKVWITPLNNCEQINPMWDRSSVAVKGSCVQKEYLKYVIHNNGSGNMNDSSEYRIYYDYTVVKKGKFKLFSKDSIELKVPSNGKTVLLEVDQAPYHPGKSFPRSFIEACGTDSKGKFSTNIIRGFTQDDADPEISIDCLPIVDSYDPNDKLVFPEGVTENHFIKPATDLEYVIRFQNTGTDVAYNIKLIDTLSSDLDISTFKVSGSSHVYTYDISGEGKPVIAFSFKNIMLPSKSVNEPGSNGFIKFNISPLASANLGTTIKNFADIYFDYNSPVRTNVVMLTLSDYKPEDLNYLKNVCDEKFLTTLNDIEDICISMAPFKLNNGTPSGGTYYGKGVVNGSFNPSVAGLGEHEITYTYIASNACESKVNSKITVTSCTGIENNSFAKNLVVFPNPAKQEVIVANSVKSNKSVKVQLLNTLGFLIEEKTISFSTEESRVIFNLEKLSKGIYLIRVDNGEERGSRIFIKE